MNFALQAFGEYLKTETASALKMRDYKDATDLIVGGGASVNEPVMMSDRKGHNGITEDGIATTLTAQDKDRPLIGGDAMTSVVRRLTPLE